MIKDSRRSESEGVVPVSCVLENEAVSGIVSPNSESDYISVNDEQRGASR